MWKPILLWLCLSSYCLAGPLGLKRNMPIIQRQEEDIEKESTAGVFENDANKPEAANSNDAPPNMQMISTLTLPSNATSIRADITDGFSCANKSYGYYADVENECQIFHVCLPVTYADGRENTFRWSFICPEETIFSQDSFTCMRREDMAIDCEESFKYYELNRNFGITNDDENKPMSMNTDSDTSTHQANEDQETAMTTQIEIEKNTQQAQIIMDEKVENPKPTQKEKPMKVQKPNRRKPGIVGIGSNFNKKKPVAPIRKEALPVTVQPAVIATTMETSPAAEEEIKPHRFTKRPSTINLKEKPQPVKQSDPNPLRIDLYNQKRKRPSIFNKKEATTLKPVEDAQPVTELVTLSANEPALPLVTQSSVDSVPEHETSTNTVNVPDLIASEASETSSVVLKPEPSPPMTDAEDIKNKKVSKPQPTEPEIIVQPQIIKTEEQPVIVPLEAIEEIPVVITEVEENNSEPEPIQTSQEVKSSIGIEETNSEITSPNIQNESTSPETHFDEPAIFQQNSEESFAEPSGPSIEEMEDKKPDNAPEVMPATSDMEHQDPMVEQMFSETEEAEANKQTMGGFKPVDPAMAAEAEALIANFLNTLMKSEKTNAEPIMPTNELVKEETKNSNEEENLPNENESASSPELQPQDIAIDNIDQESNSNLKSHTESEQHTSLMGNMEPLPSMTMMLNNHTGEILQIPVQIIQSPIEDLTEASVPAIDIPKSPNPVSIDDIVELDKDKLDQVPNTANEKETQDHLPNDTDDSEKVEPLPEQHTEQLILPIYHRVSAEPNSNMITAHAKDEDLTTENSNNLLETEMNAAEINAPTNTEIRSDIDRAYGARSIKTAKKMDPRKRRFLFKSDAS